MSIKIKLFLLIITSISILSFEPYAQINTVKFEQLDSLRSQESRNTIIFIHTDWCRFCQKMEQSTFKNKGVRELINQDFYFLSLNAEHEDDITYKGHAFKYKPTGLKTGVHELAKQLGTINGELNYPTLCILNEKDEIIFQYGGYMYASELKNVMKEVLREESIK